MSPIHDRGRRGLGGVSMHWTETTSSGFFADAEPSISSQPDQPQTRSGSLPARQLPPRHVRTRRDSAAYVRTRALSGGTVTNPSISAVLNSAPKQSPLEQLYGTIVVEDDEDDDPLSATGPPLLPRGPHTARGVRATSNFSEEAELYRRRPSFNPFLQKPELEHSDLEQEPETVQEIRDEEERANPITENKEMMHLIMDLGKGQRKIEEQLQQLVAALNQGIVS
ncbi:uncharacterized protein EI90DRAFT_3076900 [Cantharellus anzutake]|uniref:uncharacterized protein n=1 Tax=Cantharellus anzutake TaxID=1750568 RepID=UPI0019032509|nr:uncharacterized protein EI90DRAFT_3076900 [Cantharellus anzutake]KAF8323516.1 hypothetical protein EI90DRAFT_3076900 [Cantharellus anzutake]